MSAQVIGVEPVLEGAMPGTVIVRVRDGAYYAARQVCLANEGYMEQVRGFIEFTEMIAKRFEEVRTLVHPAHISLQGAKLAKGMAETAHLTFPIRSQPDGHSGE